MDISTPILEIKPTLHRIVVQFDPKANAPIQISEKSIEINTHMALIMFELKPSAGVQGACFATYPCQPIDASGVSMKMPSNILYQFHDERHLLFLNINPGVVRSELNFRLEINYHGEFFASHDPTIINAEIPGSGGNPDDDGGWDGEDNRERAKKMDWEGR